MPRLIGYRERSGGGSTGVAAGGGGYVVLGIVSKPTDPLGTFLQQYEEYLDGRRSYEDLPHYPGGVGRAFDDVKHLVMQVTQQYVRPENAAPLPMMRLVRWTRRLRP